MNLPNEKLLIARRSLEDVEGFILISDLLYMPSVDRWTMCFQIKSDSILEGMESTQWYAVLSNNYPKDRITIYPAYQGGISHTHPHQAFNSVDKNYPWKLGAPCLDEPLKIVERNVYLQEPLNSACERLKWHTERLKEWIDLASSNQLLSNDSYFEVPPTPCNDPLITLITAEDDQTLKLWISHYKKAGLFSFRCEGKKNNLRIITCFKSKNNHISYNWGAKFSKGNSNGSLGLWLLVKDLPVITEWELPQTLGQLKQTLKKQGVDLMAFIRKYAETLGGQTEFIIIIGFPIPERFGEDASQIHWLGIKLPLLSSVNTKPLKGFRRNEIGRWQKDQSILHGDLPLKYVGVENWSTQQFSRRAMLNQIITSKSFLVLGAGALGSVLVNQLVRLGVKKITVVDGDILQGGNLVRHSLSIDEVGENKATAVQNQANNSMPYAEIQGISHSFPTHIPDDINVVIDCTGSDELLNSIERFNWLKRNIEFYSFSFGINLKRFFIYKLKSVGSFSYEEFTKKLHPWGNKDHEENLDFSLPKEGIGCWHPAFPGRFDDVSIWASIAVKEIEKGINDEANNNFLVYKMSSGDGFTGIEKDSL